MYLFYFIKLGSYILVKTGGRTARDFMGGTYIPSRLSTSDVGTDYIPLPASGMPLFLP